MNTEYLKGKLLQGFDKGFLKVMKDNKCFIAGGAITSVCTNKEVNDYDIYFSNKEGLVKLIQWVKEDAWCSFITRVSRRLHL